MDQLPEVGDTEAKAEVAEKTAEARARVRVQKDQAQKDQAQKVSNI